MTSSRLILIINGTMAFFLALVCIVTALITVKQSTLAIPLIFIALVSIQAGSIAFHVIGIAKAQADRIDKLEKQLSEAR